MIFIKQKITKKNGTTIIEPDWGNLNPEEYEIVIVTKNGYFVEKKQQ